MSSATAAAAEHDHDGHQHQFDNAVQQYEASTLGMWVFLVTEVMFFGGVFTAYVVYRSMFPEVFHHGSQELNVWMGGFNTVVLIGSSLTMALAVHSAQISASRGRQIFFLVSTMFLGCVFLGVKAIEYSAKWEHGLVPGLNWHPHAANADHLALFMSLYFALTGIHAVHMVIGVGILLVIIAEAARGRYNAKYSTPVEIMGLYWHFVDIVWIFLFPLLYLLGGVKLS